MPILGIIASSFRSAAGPEGAYDALATVTVPSGGAASIDFVGIPSGYKHLQIRGSANAGDVDLNMQFNADTSTNYNYHFLYGNGTSAVAGASTSSSSLASFYASTTANIFGAGVFDILDYANTNKFKTMRALTGVDTNGGILIVFRSGAWRSTSAITSIKIFPASGSINQYSQFALYGIK